MASKEEFVKYAAEQAGGAGTITYRKMFGEYGIYCDGKIVALVCDDQLFVKITQAGRALLRDAVERPPYEGAKPCFLIEDIDDGAFLSGLIAATCAELPAPKPKRRKKEC